MKNTAYRMRAGAAALALVLTLGVLDLSAPRVEARPKVDGGAGANCTYKGVTYSEGSVIRQEDGSKYVCVDGSWKYAGY
jgi:hypothetical protein